MNWLSGLKGKILFEEPLSNHTTLKVGPRAEIWVEPYDKEDLSSLLKKANVLKKDYLIIGLGSKLLITKKKVPLAVHLCSSHFRKCLIRKNRLVAGSGLSLKELLNIAQKKGLGGLEFLNGIPATVGGAVMLNVGVGWPKRIEIGDFVDEVEAMNREGEIRVMGKKDLRFNYRSSNLGQCIILSASFRLLKRNTDNIKINMRKFLDYRMRTQDLSYPSAGCIFKNPVNRNMGDCKGVYSSGRLIDLCGLKGRQIGGAAVSRKHANFIVNLGGANPQDILRLISLIQKEVQEKFKVQLKPEIEII